MFEALERDNKAIWENDIRAPMRALLDDLTDEFGPMRMFRPNRDVRFSKDKSPYKLWVGATSESRALGGIGYYIEVSASGLITGYGAMLMARDQLARFRVALDDDASGRAFDRLQRALTTKYLPITSGAEPPLKTGPRGYTSTHPRSELLRWKSAAIVREYEKADWMHTSEAPNRIGEIWRAARPLKEWLNITSAHLKHLPDDAGLTPSARKGPPCSW